MEIIQVYKPAWQQALQDAAFKKKLIAGLALQTIILIALPFFFQHIEHRQGFILNDFVLASLPARNVSFPIFGLLWFIFVLFIIRSAQDPKLFITLLYGFVIVCLTRMITISFVQLNPPAKLIPLLDPVSNSFYGGSFVTKDLFFSGHTATLWLFFLSFRRRIDKAVALFSTVAVGFLLLVQHVHYTIDVIAAPFFTTICYILAKKIVNWPFNLRTDQAEIN